MTLLALPGRGVARRPAVAPPLVGLLAAAAAGAVVAVVRVGAGPVIKGKNVKCTFLSIKRTEERHCRTVWLPMDGGTVAREM